MYPKWFEENEKHLMTRGDPSHA